MTEHTFPRRNLLTATAFGLASSALASDIMGQEKPAEDRAAVPKPGEFPVVVISSANGLAATAKAYKMVEAGKDPLDAVVAGVALVEADPKDTSVGYGGVPNEEGVVELDAAVMHGPSHRAGAVGRSATSNIRRRWL